MPAVDYVVYSAYGEDFYADLSSLDEGNWDAVEATDFREAVVLCDIVGLSYEEISSAVAAPIGTVRSRIHRGRKMLKERLQ